MNPSPALPEPPIRTSSRPPLHAGRPSGERQRRLLMGLVAANPGVHVLRASCLLGLSWNTCLHHVRRLEGEGAIVVRKVGSKVCLFDRREGAVAPRLAPLLLKDERNSGLVRLAADSPGVSQKAMADRLGMAGSVVHRRLLRLEEAGLVHRVSRGREMAVYATDAAQAAWPVPANALPAPVGDAGAAGHGLFTAHPGLALPGMAGDPIPHNLA